MLVQYKTCRCEAFQKGKRNRNWGRVPLCAGQVVEEGGKGETERCQKALRYLEKEKDIVLGRYRKVRGVQYWEARCEERVGGGVESGSNAS